MSDEQIADISERERILREKAAREGVRVPDDVVTYIAGKYGLNQTLKGALVQIVGFARMKGQPIDMSIARKALGDPEPVPEEQGDAPQTEFAPSAATEPEEEPTRSFSSMEESLQDDEERAFEEKAALEEEALAGEPDWDVVDEPAPVDLWTTASEAPEPQPEQHVEPTPEPRPEPRVEPQHEPHVEPQPEPHVEPTPEARPEPRPEPRPESQSLFGAQPAPDPVFEQSSKAPSKVYFAPVRTTGKRSLVKRAGALLERAGLAGSIDEGDLVAIKLHFGEQGGTGFVQPIFLREVVARIREVGGKPFLTDANTLYRGERFNAVDHIACAVHNGFSYATVDAPVLIADGLDGRDAVDVPIDGFKHFDSVRIGSVAAHADAMVVVTHVKGHEATGFGGAFKNVGMGLGCRSAKQRMHSDFVPDPDPDKCTACGRCVTWCPVDAITIGPDRVASVDYEVCYGCGECVAACPYGAIAIDWKTTPESIQEKIVEHAAGALSGKEGKVVYLSFVTDVSPDCDCWHFSDASVIPDVGVLASTDPVAIDQAAYDLVTGSVGIAGTRGEGMGEGVDKFKEITGIDGTVTMAYAEEMGLGTRAYELTRLD